MLFWTATEYNFASNGTRGRVGKSSEASSDQTQGWDSSCGEGEGEGEGEDEVGNWGLLSGTDRGMGATNVAPSEPQVWLVMSVY